MTSSLPPQLAAPTPPQRIKPPQLHLRIFNSLLHIHKSSIRYHLHARTLAMQVTFFTILASFGLLAAAMPTGGSCNTGNVFLLSNRDRQLMRKLTGGPQCCATQGDAQTSTAVKTAATLLGIDLTGITGIVGITCNPITGMYVSNLTSLVRAVIHDFAVALEEPTVLSSPCAALVPSSTVS